MYLVRCAGLFVIIFSLKFSHGASRKGCALSVSNNEDEKLLPVILHNATREFNLLVPEEGFINLKHGEGVTLSCPNDRNRLELTNSNTTYATCVEGSTLNIFRKHYDFDHILCKKLVHGDVQKTNDKCADDRGKIINLGFQITKTYFEILIRVCYDEDEGNTLYTEHVLHGEGIEHGSKETYRPNFKVAGLGPDIAANVAYKRAFQKSTFNKLLGSARLADRYINSNSYLSRGHLSPDQDFLFASWQFTTYFYINVCPQWQVINSGNWASLERTIRKKAEQSQDKFLIITGTFDVLELPDSNNNPTEIFLVSGKKLPVPKFTWKIMYNPKTQDGIVFVVVNNPFLDGIHEDDVLCTNVCEMYGWGTSSWNNIRKGYIYCCDVNDFADVVDTMPHFPVKRVLRGIS